MRGDASVIKGLNEVLTLELTAINQYFLHARMLRNWGYEGLTERVYKESIRQMKVAQKVTDRILFLEGLPNYQKLLSLEIAESPTESLLADKRYCEGACHLLKDKIQLCLKKKDHPSRELLENLMIGEQAHLDWLETQQQAIHDLGTKNYLAEKINK